MANMYPVKTFEDRYNTAHILVEKSLSGETLSSTERDILLRIVIINYHETHKIAGAFSCDSSCHNCEFCNKMRKAAESDPTIICGYCYDHAQEIRMPSVKEAHGLTLYILSNVPFTVDDWKRRPISKKLRTEWENILRINSAGETENVTQGINYLNLLYANPVFFGGYWGKNVPAIVSAIRTVGKPKNTRFVQSSIHINKPDKKVPEADLVFTVYDNEKAILEALENGGCECNGKMCAQCGWKCYLPPELGGWPEGSNVCELLRLTNKKDRKKVDQALGK